MIRGAVLGSPVSHSLSPLLHQTAFSYLGIDGSYDRIEVRSGELANFIESQGKNYDYLSLTMPLKEEVIELGIPLSEIALKSRSANTLINREDVWSATSTDGIGFISALARRKFSDFTSVLILGAGGTARAVAAALDGVAQSITILGRTTSREKAFADIISLSQFSYILWSNSFDLSQFSLVVNTTPAGAADALAESAVAEPAGLFFDVIYKPWPTVLATRWQSLNAPVIAGVELLIYQGIEQLRQAIGIDFNTEELAENLREQLQLTPYISTSYTHEGNSLDNFSKCS